MTSDPWVEALVAPWDRYPLIYAFSLLEAPSPSVAENRLGGNSSKKDWPRRANSTGESTSWAGGGESEATRTWAPSS